MSVERRVVSNRTQDCVGATASWEQVMNDLLRQILLLLTILALARTVMGQGLEITLKHGTAAEAQTRDQLQRLLATYNLSPWIYTKTIVVDERAIPFSHPVLTLHARHLKDDDLLVSTFVHEQLHWFLADRQQDTEQAITDLRKVFQNVPVGGTAGARDEQSTYLHLLVCYLEQQAVRQIFGELRAKQIMDFWASDHYTWIYQTVTAREQEIAQIMRNRKLIPAR